MALNRFQSLLIAGLLPLLTLSWFAREVTGQIDFWLLWLLAMVLVGLPLVFAEIALAQRSGNSPLVGLPALTREADVANGWRGIGWLTVLLLLTLMGHLLASAAMVVQPLLPSVALAALLAILALLMIAISFAKSWAGWVALVLSALAILLNMTQTGMATQWQITPTSLTEWGIAVVLSLVGVGAGTGLYWHSQALFSTSEGTATVPASRYVLPVWGLQLVVGSVVALLLVPQGTQTLAQLPAIAGLLYAAAMLAGAGFLLSVVSRQLALRVGQAGGSFLWLVIAAVAVLALSILPTTWLNYLLAILSLLTAVWLAVFAGWQMKISHLRKSLNFSSEAIYNLWRVAVRIVVPLAIVLALIGWGIRLLGQA